MNSALPDILIQCNSDGDFLPQEKERMKAMKSKYHNILNAYALTYLAIAGLHGYLDIAFKTFNLPQSKEDAKIELQEESNKMINFSMDRDGFSGFQKLNREAGVKRTFNALVIIGLIHHQEKKLKFAIALDKFDSRMKKVLTFGQLLHKENICLFNFSFNIKECLFHNDILECSMLSNQLKHGGNERFKKLSVAYPKLICEYESKDEICEDIIIYRDDLIRYVTAFKNFWMHLYNNIEELQGDSSSQSFRYMKKSLEKSKETIPLEEKSLNKAIANIIVGN